MPERVATLEEQVQQLRRIQEESLLWRVDADRKLDTIISNQDRQAGRAEFISKLLGSLPGVFWTLTLGGMIAVISYLWHQAWPAPH